MIRLFARPIMPILIVAFASFIPVIIVSVQVVQILASLLPLDSLRMAVAPMSHFVQALMGILLRVLGALEFVRALRALFCRLHRLSALILVVTVLGRRSRALPC